MCDLFNANAHARGRRVVTVPPNPDEVLTREEVAAWLKLRPRQVARLGIPFIDLGRKTPRYLARDVLAHLDRLRRGGLTEGA